LIKKLLCCIVRCRRGDEPPIELPVDRRVANPTAIRAHELALEPDAEVKRVEQDKSAADVEDYRGTAFIANQFTLPGKSWGLFDSSHPMRQFTGMLINTTLFHIVVCMTLPSLRVVTSLYLTHMLPYDLDGDRYLYIMRNPSTS
jgi:hypothetical protein